MEEIPLFFLNKHIKLIKDDGFVLDGFIRKVNSSNILFESRTATSLIEVERIKELVLKKEANHGKLG